MFLIGLVVAWQVYSLDCRMRFRDIRFVELVGNGTVGAMEFVTKELGVKASFI